MKYVRTILGNVSADQIGITYSHEHTVSQPPRQFKYWEPDLVLDSVPKAVAEALDFKELGGNCVIDASAIDYGRNVGAMAEVSSQSGIHLVATSGFNKGAYFTPEIEALSEDGFFELIHREATEGIEGTSHRPGMLKFGTSYNFITPAEERAARAVCRVQKKTGLPLYTHTEIGTLAMEQLSILRDEGVDLERVCIGHLDRNPDPNYIRQVLKAGVFVGIDQISKIKYHTEATRLDLIKYLVKIGYGKRILISGDMARRSYLRSYGGGPGFAYILKMFIPRLRDELREDGVSVGVADDIIADLLVNNPRDFLEMSM
ncbi:MAG: phosphotriesterase-related protein [Bacillota bacterium]